MNEALIEARRRAKWSQAELAEAAKCSTLLVEILEEGGVTHPNIAIRIGKALGLRGEALMSLVPKKYRGKKLKHIEPPVKMWAWGMLETMRKDEKA